MTTVEVRDEEVPVVSYLKLGERPTLTGFRCPQCGAVFLLRRSACASCGQGDLGERVDLARTGVVHAATFVHRASPGVATPFMSGVVALDGGGFARATIVGSEDPVAAVGRKVMLTTRTVATDSAGAQAVGFQFEIGDEK